MSRKCCSGILYFYTVVALQFVCFSSLLKKTITWGIFQTTKKTNPRKKDNTRPGRPLGIFLKKTHPRHRGFQPAAELLRFWRESFFRTSCPTLRREKRQVRKVRQESRICFFLGGFCWEKQDIKIRASKICGNSYWKRIDIRKHFHWDVGRVHFSMSHSDQWISLNCIIYITARKAYFKDAAFLFGSINIIRSSCLEVYQISEAVLTWWNPSHTHHTHMVSKTIIPMDMWTSVGTSSEYDIDT